MSCNRMCFEDGEWKNHDNCATCPGQDSGQVKDCKVFCAECETGHLLTEWPHKPEKTEDLGGE